MKEINMKKVNELKLLVEEFEGETLTKKQFYKKIYDFLCIGYGVRGAANRMANAELTNEDIDNMTKHYTKIIEFMKED